MEKNFLSCYEEVFNEDGTQKACGREKCIKLIEAAEKLCPSEPIGKFGLTKTGQMNVDELKKLKHLVKLGVLY